MYDKSRCVFCRNCINTCSSSAISIYDAGLNWDGKRCIGCNSCIDACENDAISFIGKEMSAKSIIDMVLRDISFFDETGGGVTFTGGEPFNQYHFLINLLKMSSDEYIHTCVETCGYTTLDKIIEAMPYVDLFLYDVKLASDIKHKDYTGVSNKTIIDNLRYLISSGADVEVRIPLICNNDGLLEDGSEMAELLESMGAKKVWILPYHNYGVYKYERLGKPYSTNVFRKPSKDEITQYANKLKDKGLDVLIEGEALDE
jgi:pyruvate formate lyase activating enzyme